jgi:cell division topological specificity factor
MLKTILDWLFNLPEKGSRQSAKNRMKLMVIHDRQQMPPAQVEKMKKELLEVMSKYFEIDPEQAECIIQSSDDRSAVISTNVPLLPKGLKKKAGALN